MKLAEDLFLVGSGRMGAHLTHAADCNGYLMIHEDIQILIDTGTGLDFHLWEEQLLWCGTSLKNITHVLLTHVHADHAGGAAKIKEASNALLYAPASAKEILIRGDETAIDLNAARKFGFYPEDYSFPGISPDVSFQDGQEIDIGPYSIKIISTPGHSKHCSSFYIESAEGRKRLFSGDTVFGQGKISMLSTHDFDLQKLKQSIQKLSFMHVDELLPGHNMPVLKNGSSHIEEANMLFQQLGVPENIL
ncbi:MBL fold metallo-hydrolase [Alkalicoccus daliensis]|uniref:beta-lactamase n=1 Tax=Alkalicoccus daliensis TaxID=745820 RepID=A0A1H0GDQ9_9BACI|nr:MBL fold metallo-hydrolase [Alkalicoccus daliensis]SDO05012.1 Glyoxylase, beta-lactamase superfamily II [Alkalicoccus daliensis]